MEFFTEKNLFEGYIIQRCGAISGENESLWKDKVKRDYKHADSRKVTKIKRSEILGEVPLIFCWNQFHTAVALQVSFVRGASFLAFVLQRNYNCLGE